MSCAIRGSPLRAAEIRPNEVFTVARLWRDVRRRLYGGHHEQRDDRHPDAPQQALPVARRRAL